MPSPFPGMDPYLEEPDLWPEFDLIVAMRARLKKTLPKHYAAFVDRYVWLHEPDADTRKRLAKPDVGIRERRRTEPAGGSVATLDAPAFAALPVVRQEGERYIRIIDRHSRRIVTVIELLSPANKEAGKDRDAYLVKRNEFLAKGTNVVEIDLLRAGQRLPMGKPAPPKADYYVMVARSVDFPRTAIWPFSVRDPLPTIPVPLNPEDKPASLPLKSCFDRAYEAGGYGEEIDYGEPSMPPLRGSDAVWARDLLRKRR